MQRIPTTLLRSIALAAAVAGLSCCATVPSGERASPQAARVSTLGRTCMRTTGSRIPAPPGQCLAVPGRSYGSEDVERTGAVNAAQALSLLDPAVTAH